MNTIEGTGKLVPGPYRTIDDIRRANERAGECWFAPGQGGRYARSHEIVFGGRYFITSGRVAHTRQETGPRRYTIRRANDDGTVENASEFQALSSAQQANAAARRLVKLIMDNGMSEKDAMELIMERIEAQEEEEW
jgi:hypothetical protein